MRLGAGTTTDLLAVSLSTTDAVGHRFGPDSREIHDQILRLDRFLGTFLDSLFKLRDSTRVVIAMTSDHGVSPLPGAKSRDANQSAGKVNLRPAIVPLFASLRAAGVDTSGFRFDDEGILVLDDAALERVGLRADAVIRMFAISFFGSFSSSERYVPWCTAGRKVELHNWCPITGNPGHRTM